MLEQSRFLAMKKLANDIRKEKEKTFKSFENSSVDDAIREKDELIESIIDNMDVAFSEGDKGKEEKQIFRANLLIPDDVAFFEAYSKDKNIRNLMNKYSVGIEDIMSKITELNLYSKYIETFNAPKKETPKVEEKPEPKEDKKVNFVDDMVNLSSKEAESLLDEIEDLSSAMEELDIRKNNKPEEKEENKPSLEPEVVEESSPSFAAKTITDEKDVIAPFNFNSKLEEINEEEADEDNDESEADEIVPFNFNNKKEIKDEKEDEDMIVPFNFDIDEEEDKQVVTMEEESDVEITGEIENISSAVAEFVDEYTKVKKELDFTQAKIEKFTSEKEELRRQVAALREEKESVESINAELREELEKATEELKRETAENDNLRTQIKGMEKNAKQSTDLLKEIYKSIPKKRFNVK